MAFNVGSFVGGMFDGFKSGQDIIKAHNELRLQAMDREAAQSAMGNIEAGVNIPGEPNISVTYPDASGSGSTPTPAVEPGAGGPSRAASSKISDPEAVSKIANVLQEAGINHAGISGVLGWLSGETAGFDPYGHNDIKGGHTGLFQWDDKIRWPRYVNEYLPKHGGGDPYDRENQVKYWLWEQENTDEKKYGVLDGLRNAKTPEEANRIVGLTQRAGVPHIGLDMAKNFYWNGYGPAVGSGTSVRPGAPAAPQEAATEVEGSPIVPPAATPAPPPIPAAPVTSALGSMQPSPSDTNQFKTQRQQNTVTMNARGQPLFPPGTKFNSRGEAVSSALGSPAEGQQVGAAGLGGRPNFGVASPAAQARRDALSKEFGSGPQPQESPAQAAPLRTSALSDDGSGFTSAVRRAPDGRDYMPDPDRPGKWLMLDYG